MSNKLNRLFRNMAGYAIGSVICLSFLEMEVVVAIYVGLSIGSATTLFLGGLRDE